MMRNRPCLFILALVFLFSCGKIFGQDPSTITDIEFILDASNSMNESAGGEVKIVTAKSVLTRLIRQVAAESPAHLNLGLRVYGNHFNPHGTKEQACQDSTLEIPIQGVKGDLLCSKAMSVEAKGYTPIAYSLLQTRNDFQTSQDHRKFVILVSDGKESCGGDPCEVARQLKASGIEATIHVIGFAVDDETKKLLSCIAEATGGIFVSADDPQALQDALQKTLKASQMGRLFLTGPHQAVGKVMNSDGGILGGLSSGQSISLDEGTYLVNVHVDGRELNYDSVMIRQGEDTYLNVELPKGGTLTFSLIGMDRVDRGTTGKLIASDGRIVGMLKVGETQEFPAGSYKLEVDTDVEKMSRDDVLIKEGEDTVVTLRTKRGRLELGIFEDGVDVANKTTVVVYNAGTEEEISAAVPVKPKIFSLEAGSYDVLANFPESKTQLDQWLKNITIEAGSKVSKEIDFSLGILLIKAALNGEGADEFSIYIYKEGASASKEAKLDRYYVADVHWAHELRKPLPEGRYDVWVQHQKSANLAPQWLSGLEVKFGSVTERTVDFGTGRLKVRASMNDAEEDSFEVYVYQSGASKARREDVKTFYITDSHWKSLSEFLLIPGIYDVWVGYQKAPNIPPQWVEGIEIKAGEDIEKRLEFTSGTLKASATVNSQSAGGDFYFAVYPQGSAGKDKDELPDIVHDASWQTKYSITLAAGIYDLWASYQRSPNVPGQWVQDIEVKKNETSKAAVDFSVGTLKVKAQTNGPAPKEFSFEVYRQGASTADQDELQKLFVDRVNWNNECKMLLAPGTYDIYVSHQKSQSYSAEWVKGVEVKSGETSELTVPLTKPQ